MIRIQVSSKTINIDNDEILKQNSSFGVYIDEYEKIFRYRDNILSKNTYMNCKKRKTSSKLHKFVFMGLDILKLKVFDD